MAEWQNGGEVDYELVLNSEILTSCATADYSSLQTVIFCHSAILPFCHHLPSSATLNQNASY